MLQARLFGLRGAESRARVDELLDRFGLATAGGRTTSTYSGGMRRKLDIALGLVHRPRVLFLDEPTTGLDPDARLDLWHEIRHLASDEGMTVLLTTHYLEEADALAERLAIVDRGVAVAIGTPTQLKREVGAAAGASPPTLGDVYLHHTGRSFPQAEHEADRRGGPR